MTAPTRGAERARPKATDLDRSGLAKAPWLKIPARSRCVLHLMQSPGAGREDRPDDEQLEQMARARHLAGIPEDHRSAWVDPAHAVVASPLRGVAWAHFPVVGTPRHEIIGPPSMVAFGPKGPTCRSGDLAEAIARTAQVIVHLPEGWDAPPDAGRETDMAWLYRASALAAGLHENADTVLVAPDGTGAGTLSDLVFLSRDIAPLMRFRYSYAVNFGAMAFGLLDQALAEPEPEAMDLLRTAEPRLRVDPGMFRQILKRDMPRLPGHPPEAERIRSPLAVQILYHLRRSGGIAPYRPVGDATGPAWQHGLLDRDDDADVLTWRGTGKHPPKPIDPAEATGAVDALVRYQLLKFAADGRTVTLSKAGQAFLDLLPPAFEDADLPCRWGTYPMGGDVQAAMDAWIARAFGKLKARAKPPGNA